MGTEGKKKPDEYAPDFDFRIFGRAASVGEETGAGAAEGRVAILLYLTQTAIATIAITAKHTPLMRDGSKSIIPSIMPKMVASANLVISFQI